MLKVRLILIFCFAGVHFLLAQKTDFAVEVAAFAERVPLSYFNKLKNVYETIDANEIYRYYIDASNKTQAEELKREVRAAGFVHARIMDYVYLRQFCSAQCGWTPPSVLNEPLNNKDNSNITNNKSSMNIEVYNKMAFPPKRKKGAIFDDSTTAKTIGNEIYIDKTSNNLSEDTAPNETAEWELLLKKIGDKTYDVLQKEDSVMQIEWVFFDFARFGLRYKSRVELRKTAYILRKYPTFKVALHAHTDSKGSPAANQKLSLKRATAAQNYLLRKGAKPQQIEIQSHGQEKPVAHNELPNGADTPQGRQFNRRVEINILDKNIQPVEIVDVIEIPANLKIK